jgi:hypothetical protein
MLCRNGNEGSKYNHKNALIDPEKMYSIMACERDGDPVDMLCRMKELWIPKHNFNIAFSFKRILKGKLSCYPTPKKRNNSRCSETLLTQVSGVDYTFR